MFRIVSLLRLAAADMSTFGAHAQIERAPTFLAGLSARLGDVVRRVSAFGPSARGKLHSMWSPVPPVSDHWTYAGCNPPHHRERQGKSRPTKSDRLDQRCQQNQPDRPGMLADNAQHGRTRLAAELQVKAAAAWTRRASSRLSNRLARDWHTHHPPGVSVLVTRRAHFRARPAARDSSPASAASRCTPVAYVG
jgi:hypothetical protein